jgi:hypothetical protein
MLLLRQRPLNGYVYVRFSLPNRCHCLPPVVRGLPPCYLDALQIRLKTGNAKHSRNTNRLPSMPSSSSQTRTPRPSQSRETLNKLPSPMSLRRQKKPTSQSSSQATQQIYEKFTRRGKFLHDLLNWERSRFFLSILVNSVSFIIFCLWIREAHISAKFLATSSSESDVNEKKGKYVPATTDEKDKDPRFITFGQEWLLDNFTVTPINFREGRYWTFFTSIFSHQVPIQIALNMLASHIMLTRLCPIFGTIPVALSILLGGVSANMVMAAWMKKRGGDSYNDKYPGQFFGVCGMTAANLSVLGFGAAAYPRWVIRLYGIVPVKVGHVVLVAWAVEAIQYWRQTGWEKIQSTVRLHKSLFANHRPMDI